MRCSEPYLASLMQPVLPVQDYFTLHLQSLTSLLLLHEASDACKQQLENTFVKFCRSESGDFRNLHRGGPAE